MTENLQNDSFPGTYLRRRYCIILCFFLPVHCDLVDCARVYVTKVSSWAATHVTGIVRAGVGLGRYSMSPSGEVETPLQLVYHSAQAHTCLVVYWPFAVLHFTVGFLLSRVTHINLCRTGVPSVLTCLFSGLHYLQYCIGTCRAVWVPGQDLATPHLMYNCGKLILSPHCTLYVSLCMVRTGGMPCVFACPVSVI